MEISNVARLSKKVIGVKGTRAAAKGALTVRKYSPEILTGLGIVGSATAFVMAARATLSLEEKLELMRMDIALVKEKQVEVHDDGTPIYDPTEIQKDLVKAYTRGVFDLVKLYGPSVGLEIASIICILGAHGIMQKRQVALIAAYNAVSEGFNTYRKRVVDELGVEKDREFYSGQRIEEVTAEDGTVSQTLVPIDKIATSSKYAKWFDEGSDYWEPVADYNLSFLTARQNMFNDQLATKGYVFLNDVYEVLGLEKTQAGQVVGWYINENGDNFIDFGIFANDPGSRNFVNGSGMGILLDFNVDGIIIDKIKTPFWNER